MQKPPSPPYPELDIVNVNRLVVPIGQIRRLCAALLHAAPPIRYLQDPKSHRNKSYTRPRLVQTSYLSATPRIGNYHSRQTHCIGNVIASSCKQRRPALEDQDNQEHQNSLQPSPALGVYLPDMRNVYIRE